MSDEPSLGRVFDAVTRVEMEIGFMRKERAEDKEARNRELVAQDRLNADYETRLRDLKNNQEQRKGISSVAALVFGTVGGAVAAFFLAQLVANPSAPSTPQLQTNCGTFTVVGGSCPAVSSSKSPSGSAPKSSTAPEVDRRISTALNRPAPQQPSNRVAAGQQKAITNPKAKAKKPIAKARVKKGHKK